MSTFIIIFLSAVRGKPSKPAKVALIGTHADVAQCHRNLQGDFVAPQVHLLQVGLIKFGKCSIKAVLLCVSHIPDEKI